MPPSGFEGIERDHRKYIMNLKGGKSSKIAYIDNIRRNNYALRL